MAAAAAAAGKDDDDHHQYQLALLGSPVSPFSARARMALSVKGVRYEYVEEDLFNKSRLLRRSNPVHRKVPVLIHNGRPVCESLVIVEYVDEAFAGAAPSILPADPYDRAVARFWAAYVDHQMLPDWLGIMKATTSEARLEMLKRSHAKMRLMEAVFFASKCSDDDDGDRKHRFFGGSDSVGYLDLALGAFLFWFKTIREMFGADIVCAGNTPLLSAWAARFMDTAAAKEAAPQGSRMAEHVRRVYRPASSAL